MRMKKQKRCNQSKPTYILKPKWLHAVCFGFRRCDEIFSKFIPKAREEEGVGEEYVVK